MVIFYNYMGYCLSCLVWLIISGLVNFANNELGLPGCADGEVCVREPGELSSLDRPRPQRLELQQVWPPLRL
jgi:hypothetical protein